MVDVVYVFRFYTTYLYITSTYIDNTNINDIVVIAGNCHPNIEGNISNRSDRI